MGDRSAIEWTDNSMSDLFHESLSFETVARIFHVMARPECERHTFQILTKRPARMLEFFAWAASRKIEAPWEGVTLPNVWLGVSAEDQANADARIPLLLKTPAAVRFVSAEPLLGPINFRKCGVGFCRCQADDEFVHKHYAEPPHSCARCNACEAFTGLDWVIVGGESGPGSRPMDPNWARSIRDQCVSGRVAFFLKQYGDWAPCYPGSSWEPTDSMPWHYFPGGPKVWRCGKARAGRGLDGSTWNQMPGAPDAAL